MMTGTKLDSYWRNVIPIVAILMAGALWRSLSRPAPSSASAAAPLVSAAALSDGVRVGETGRTPASRTPAESAARAREFSEKLGIEVTAVQLAVNGSRINLRYRVLDAERATEIFDSANRAYLLDAAGRNLARPNSPVSEPLRGESGQMLRAGRTYTYFFPNPGHVVKAGDTVTLAIGNYRVEGLVVR